MLDSDIWFTIQYPVQVERQPVRFTVVDLTGFQGWAFALFEATEE